MTLVWLACGVRVDAATEDESVVEARKAMVAEIAAMARDTATHTGRPRLSTRVETALLRVPRHRFVPESQRRHAYENRPLAIGHGQTISQPFIVALSTDLLDLEAGHRVLEVGTGSGYQAAVLGELAQRVYTIEILEPLGRAAAARLAELHYDNVETRIGDGYRGWPEQAPFDRILVTAAARDVPPPLVEQLAAGGRMVIPVDSGRLGQDLVVIEKRPDGTVVRTTVLPVRFVPLTGPGARGR